MRVLNLRTLSMAVRFQTNRNKKMLCFRKIESLPKEDPMAHLPMCIGSVFPGKTWIGKFEKARRSACGAFAISTASHTTWSRSF
jgi:hypothetical protein